MKLRILTVVMLMFAFITLSQAQDYKSAIGGKTGYGLIATYKTFLNTSSAIDVFGGIRWGGFVAGAYYLKHHPVESIDHLKWYWGVGGSFTTWDYGYVGYDNYYELGVSGVLGLDYAFDDLPLNLSVDWAPTLVLLDSYDYPGKSLNRFRSVYGSVSIRYILNR